MGQYNDRERIFVQTKNWNSCVPDEVRKSVDFTPIYPSEPPAFPRRHPSPLLTGGRGTDGLGESVEKAEGDKHEGGGIGRKRPRNGPPTSATIGASLLSIQLTTTTSTATGSMPVYQH